MSYSTQVVRATRVERLVGQRHTLLHVLLLAVGLGLFVIGNTHEGLWLDESYTAAMVKQTPIQILRAIIGDNHPPLYYLALSLFVAILGRTVFTLRLFSALGALALAALGAGPLRRATNARVGLLYTFLVVATPATLTEAQEARMYSWAASLVTACAIYAFLASRDNQRSDWALFGLFSVAAAYTHYYALLAVILLHALTLVWLARRPDERLRRYWVTAVLAGLAYLPWLIPLGLQTRRVVGYFWVPEISLQVVQDSLRFPFGYKWGFPELLPSSLAFGLVVLLGLGGCGYAVRRRLPVRQLLLLSLGAYTLLVVIVVVASYAIRPVLTQRYMMTVTGLLWLPAAYGLAALPWRALRLALCGAFLVLMVPLLGHIQQEQFNGPWPDVIQTLSAQAGPDAVFVHASLHTLGPLAYYFPDATHVLYSPSIRQTLPLPFYGPHVWYGPEPSAVPQGHGTLWLIGCGNPECDVVDEWLAAGKFGAVEYREEFSQPYSWLTISATRVRGAQP